MATDYSVIRGFARAFLGDFVTEDFTNYQYPDAVLNSHIELVIAELDESNIAADPANNLPSPALFTEDLSNKNKVRVSLRVAINVIAPDPDQFAYVTPVHSVKRQRNTALFVNFLKQKLDEAEGTTLVFAKSTEIDDFVNYCINYMHDIDNALANQ